MKVYIRTASKNFDYDWRSNQIQGNIPPVPDDNFFQPGTDISCLWSLKGETNLIVSSKTSRRDVIGRVIGNLIQLSSENDEEQKLLGCIFSHCLCNDSYFDDASDKLNAAIETLCEGECFEPKKTLSKEAVENFVGIWRGNEATTVNEDAIKDRFACQRSDLEMRKKIAAAIPLQLSKKEDFMVALAKGKSLENICSALIGSKDVPPSIIIFSDRATSSRESIESLLQKQICKPEEGETKKLDRIKNIIVDRLYKNIIISCFVILSVLLFFLMHSSKYNMTLIDASVLVEKIQPTKEAKIVIKKGQTVCIIANKKKDYEFKEWKTIGLSLKKEDIYSNPLEFVMPGKDISIKAIYEEKSSRIDDDNKNVKKAKESASPSTN